MSSASSSQGSSSILARVRRHDSQAWTQLVDLYAPLVIYWCRRSGLDSHSAADVVQDVFAAVVRGIHGYEHRRGSGSFRGWLWTITRNKLCTWWTRHGGSMGVGGSTALRRLSEIPSVESTIPEDEPTSAIESKALLNRAVAQVECQFEPQTWAAFWRTTVDGLPTESVATELGMTPAAVRQARSRVLRRLRQQLGDVE